MRRYIFYLAVALLAFGIGSFVVFKFYWITEVKLVSKEGTNIATETLPEKSFGTGFGTGSSERRLNEPVYVPKLYKATCSDKKILPIWNELRKDKEFKQREKEFYQKADCSDLIEIDKIDLNDDGQKEFVIWGRYNFCGGTGNCALWIYEKKKDKFKQLLQSSAYYGESRWFEAQKNKTNGYSNLLLKGHFTAAETTYSFYKFNGRKYVENKCLFEVYSMNEEKPSFMTCKEYDEKTEKELREAKKLLESNKSLQNLE